MLPLQASGIVNAAAQEAAAKTVGLGDLIMAGGWLMIPLALLFGAAIFIFVERFMVIRKASSVDVGFMKEMFRQP